MKEPWCVPYYLLLVGDPQEMTFNFQHELGLSHRVGRVHFDTYEECANYATNVVEAETQLMRRRVIAFLGGESLNTMMSHLAIGCLGERLEDSTSLKSPRCYEDFRSLLSNRSTPAFLLIISQARWLAALSSADASNRAYLRGTTIFYWADFSAGVLTNSKRSLSRKNFVARLPKRLLGTKDGAIAFIGHVSDVPVSLSLLRPEYRKLYHALGDALESLMEERPVGRSLESFARTYASLTVNLMNLREMAEISTQQAVEEKLSYLDRAIRATKCILIGDPAVKFHLRERGT